MIAQSVFPSRTTSSSLDNLSVHNMPVVRQHVEAAGAKLLFLPPYWPGSSPIEPVWSKVEALLRRSAAAT